MNIFQIAWRSIRHRGLGSWLTVLSMALGVMMVVAVLSIHGIVSRSFKNNNSFGYNIIVGARGGGMQLTMNTVYYLSQPVENIPYEYYLAFCDTETRQKEVQNSFAYKAVENELQAMDLINQFDGPLGIGQLGNAIFQDVYSKQQADYLQSDEEGLYKTYTHIAIPLCLGDYWDLPEKNLSYRCVGTKPGFFEKLLIDIDSPFPGQIDCINCSLRFKGDISETISQLYPAFEDLVDSSKIAKTGAAVENEINKQLTEIAELEAALEQTENGELDFEQQEKVDSKSTLQSLLKNLDGLIEFSKRTCPRCSAPATELLKARGRKFSFSSGRVFEEFNRDHGYFECVLGSVVAKRSGAKVGDVINPTHGDPNSANAHIHDQGFTIVGILDQTGTPHDRVVFLNIEGFYLMEDHVKPIEDDSIFATSDNEADEEGQPVKRITAEDIENFDPFAFEQEQEAAAAAAPEKPSVEVAESEDEYDPSLKRIPLPIEQREVTSILVRTSLKDQFGVLAMMLPPQINQGDLETTLRWSSFRPVKSQKAAQAVSPVEQVSSLFQLFVDPVQWMLLALTIMICIVSAISILVGIYNSMSQRQHEIAVIRALGANRSKVMSIMLIEAILLALMGGVLGWVAGHGLNVALSPLIESRTGVGIGFFDFAPAVPIFANSLLGNLKLPAWLLQLSVSPEILLIPGLMALAVVVGIYPAVSAYKTDVSTALGK